MGQNGAATGGVKELSKAITIMEGLTGFKFRSDYTRLKDMGECEVEKEKKDSHTK